MQLRDYQTEALDALWQELKTQSDALLVLPTAGGKTEIFFALCQRAMSIKPDIRIVILLNKVQLVSQTLGRARREFPVNEIGEFCGTRGSYDFTKPLTIGSIQSLSRVDPEHVHLLIVDEAHRLNPDDESQYMRLIGKLRDRNPRLKLVGVTATPYRATGVIYGPNKLFRRITYQRPLRQMIAEKYLVHPIMKRANEQFDTDGLKIVAGDYAMAQLETLTKDSDKIDKQIADALPRLDGRKKIIWACVGIEHARLVHSKLSDAAIVHSKLSQKEREEQLASFERGSARHLVFVTIVSEGYDFPPIDGVVLMRPTRSPVLYVQTVGRALRPYDGKENCIVLDYGRVVQECGPLDRPNIPRKGKKKAVQDPLDTPMRFCSKCLEYMQASIKTCPACGHVEAPDPAKNLTRKAAAGDIMSEPKPPEWIEINYINVVPHPTKSGNTCLAITYFPKDWRRMPIKEYATFNFFWRDITSRSVAKMKALGLEIASEADAKEWIRQFPTGKKCPLTNVRILVKQDKFPEVTKVESNEQQRPQDNRAPYPALESENRRL